jgi:hypothetical protein
MTDILGPASTTAVTVRPTRTIVRGQTNTWFKDCTSQQLMDGTMCPADYFNDGLAQLRQAFTSAGINQDNGDDMLWRSIQQVGVRYGTDVGTAQALKCNFTVPVLNLAVGPPYLICIVKAGHASVGPSTFQADQTAPAALAWGDGAPVSANDWAIGDQLLTIYNGTSWDLVSVGKRATAPAAPAGGQCYLAYQTGSQLLLQRYGGSNLIVNQTPLTIPPGGVVLPVTGLSPATYYYIYGYNNGGVLALRGLTTGHVQGPDGTEVCSTDASQALVGACFVNMAGNFADADGSRFVLSFFNRRLKRSRMQLAAAVATGSSNYIELSSAMRNNFISWADEATLYALSGSMYSTGGQLAVAGIGYDGNQPLPEVGVAGIGTPGSNGFGSPGVFGANYVTEGVPHFITAMGAVISGPGTAYFSGQTSTNPQSPITSNVIIHG